MLRALGAFLALFSLLSLAVNLNLTGYVFGMAALSLFGVDLLRARFSQGPWPSRIREEPLH